MNDLDKMVRDSFNDGVRYALDYLSSVFEGIEETDLWADVYGEGNNE